MGQLRSRGWESRSTIRDIHTWPYICRQARCPAQCVDTWPLARCAQAGVNGLGYAAANVVAPLLASNLADHQQVLWNNGHNPPHPRSRIIHNLLLLHSDTYRMMFRAHSDLLMLEAAGSNIKVSAIIQGSLMHMASITSLSMSTPLVGKAAAFWAATGTL